MKLTDWSMNSFCAPAVPGLRLDGKSLVIDCANGAASAIARELFEQFGGKLRLTHIHPNGRNINAACGALHPEVVAKETKELGADIGITFDGDADRVLFADALGHVVNGDALLLLAARDLQSRRQLKNDVVVATTMSQTWASKQRCAAMESRCCARRWETSTCCR